jgi:hypothetical protein
MMIVSVMRSMDMPEFFSASVALWPFLCVSQPVDGPLPRAATASRIS